jgi:hypothetical protein
MLLWHDSFGYAHTDHFAFQYPSYVGTPSTVAHRVQGSRALTGAFLRFSLPTLTAPLTDTCIIGLLLNVSSIDPSWNNLIEIRTSGGSSIQVRFLLESIDANYFQIRVERGQNDDLLLVSPHLEKNKWMFLEIKATILTSEAKIILRLDGTEIARAEGLRTEAGVVDRHWDSIRISTTNPIADLYLLDDKSDHGLTYTTFLGPVKHSKFICGKEQSWEWANTLAPVIGSAKTRLVVLAGQSNMLGRGFSASSVRWRSLNTKIRIWDRIQHAAAWDSLKALANTSGMFLVPPVSTFWGPEMRFAERVALLYENAALSGTPSVRIVKGAQDASYLFPTVADFCWNPGVANNLYNGNPVSGRSSLLLDVQAAVADLGGWSNIERVDFFWYQGESDSLNAIAPFYYGYLKQLMAQVRLDFLAPLTIHVLRIPTRSSFVTAQGFNGNLIREFQRDYAREFSDARMLDLDGCDMPLNDIHHTELGFDKVGDVVFESWVREQNFRTYIDDYSAAAALDDLYIASSVLKPASLASFSPEGRESALNSPCLGLASKMQASSPAPGVTFINEAGGILFPGVLVSTASWQNFRQTVARIQKPEELEVPIKLHL